MNHYDYVIVGSGIAGLYAALLAQEHGSVLLHTESPSDERDARLVPAKMRYTDLAPEPTWRRDP